MIEITKEEIDKYFDASDDFYFADVGNGSSLYFRKKDHSLIAYQDADGKCYSRTQYWVVKI